MRVKKKTGTKETEGNASEIEVSVEVQVNSVWVVWEGESSKCGK